MQRCVKFTAHYPVFTAQLCIMIMIGICIAPADPCYIKTNVHVVFVTKMNRWYIYVCIQLKVTMSINTFEFDENNFILAMFSLSLSLSLS